jgi:archaemetzincin
MKPVRLVALGEVDRRLLDNVRTAVGREFGVACAVASSPVDPTFAFHPERGQYHSTEIVRRLAALSASETVVGIAAVDLFIPILTYVFGEAQMNGTSAVVSFHRFADELYALPPNPALLLERLTKTVIHELGHVYGLVHCPDHDCVMAAAHAVEWVDLKGSTLCEECRSALVAVT